MSSLYLLLICLAVTSAGTLKDVISDVKSDVGDLSAKEEHEEVSPVTVSVEHELPLVKVEHQDSTPLQVTLEHDSTPATVVEHHNLASLKGETESKVDKVDFSRSEAKESGLSVVCKLKPALCKGGNNLGFATDLKFNLPHVSVGGDISFNGDDYLNEIANLGLNLKNKLKKLNPLTGLEGFVNNSENNLNKLKDLVNLHILKQEANKGQVNILCKLNPALCTGENDLGFLLKSKASLSLDLKNELASLLESLKGKRQSQSAPVAEPAPVSVSILCKLHPTLCTNENDLELLLKPKTSLSLDVKSELASLLESLKGKELSQSVPVAQPVPISQSVPVSQPVPVSLSILCKLHPALCTNENDLGFLSKPKTSLTLNQKSELASLLESLKGKGLSQSVSVAQPAVVSVSILCKLHPTLCANENELGFLQKPKASLSLDLKSELASLLESLNGKELSQFVPATQPVPVSQPVPVAVSQPIQLAQPEPVNISILCKLHPALCANENDLGFLLKPKASHSLDLNSELASLLDSLKGKELIQSVPVAQPVSVAQPVPVVQPAPVSVSILCKLHPALCANENDLGLLLKPKASLSLDLKSKLASLLESLNGKGISQSVPVVQPVPVSQPVSVNQPVPVAVSQPVPVAVSQPVSMAQPVAVSQDFPVGQYSADVTVGTTVSQPAPVSQYNVGVPLGQYGVGTPVSVRVPELYSAHSFPELHSAAVTQDAGVPMNLGASLQGSLDSGFSGGLGASNGEHSNGGAAVSSGFPLYSYHGTLPHDEVKGDYSRRSGGSRSPSFYGVGAGTQRAIPMAGVNYRRRA